MTPSNVLSIIEIFLCVFYIAAIFGSGRSTLTDILTFLIFVAYTIGCIIGIFSGDPIWMNILNAIVAGVWASLLHMNIKNPLK
jgi:FtsH-binding integral membrane protein